MTADEIRAWRRARGLSQAQLARLLQIPIDTVQNWEIGRRHAPAYLARALADVARELIQAARERDEQDADAGVAVP